MVHGIDVFEAVAAGEMTAEEGADRLMAADRAARDAAKPTWLPRWAWVACGLGVAFIAAMFGIQRHD